MPSTTKAKAPGRQTQGLKENSTNTRKFSAKSTATEAQHARILEMLRSGRKTTFDFRRAGILAPAARIIELNKRGFHIERVALLDLYDSEGYRHQRIALYALYGEPERGT